MQRIAGLALIGHVYIEALIIAHGDGRNGKSTFWNVLARVMGSYSGNISADALTVGCKRNVKPELAETKGKRLLIAAELKEGMRLNTSVVKQFCTTDEIYAEKKYKDPFALLNILRIFKYVFLDRISLLRDAELLTWAKCCCIMKLVSLVNDIVNIRNYSVDRSTKKLMKKGEEKCKKRPQKQKYLQLLLLY